MVPGLFTRMQRDHGKIKWASWPPEVTEAGGNSHALRSTEPQCVLPFTPSRLDWEEVGITRFSTSSLPGSTRERIAELADFCSRQFSRLSFPAILTTT